MSAGFERQMEEKNKTSKFIGGPEAKVINEDESRCPKCGSGIHVGYGLAYGGMGAYECCLNSNGCDWFIKWPDEETS